MNFFVFVFSLLVVRLYFLARFFIFPAFSEPILMKALFITRDTIVPYFSIGQYVCLGQNCISIGHLAYALLGGLWFLHVNWFIRAVGVLIKALKNGNVEGDNRYEEKEIKIS